MLPFQDEGYKPRFCHVSSKFHAMKNGGQRVHGWALWRFMDASGTMIIAERHSVWEEPDGTLIDITPPASGGGATLFVRDDTASIEKSEEGFLLRSDRTNIEGMRMFRGQPTEKEFWHFKISDLPETASYASSIGCDWAYFLTIS